MSPNLTAAPYWVVAFTGVAMMVFQDHVSIPLSATCLLILQTWYMFLRSECVWYVCAAGKT